MISSLSTSYEEKFQGDFNTLLDERIDIKTHAGMIPVKKGGYSFEGRRWEISFSSLPKRFRRSKGQIDRIKASPQSGSYPSGGGRSPSSCLSVNEP